MSKEALQAHEQHQGKWATTSKVKIDSPAALALYYSPGVAAPCLEIARDPKAVSTYTNRQNTIAVVSDGSAVLGLGDIGPEAALPVIEGKAILFKELAAVDAVPIVINSKNVDEIINTITMIAPSFGGINLEDIAAPRCFTIEKKLKANLNIPIFHDDQHGTAVVVSAALLNCARLTGKKLTDLNVILFGLGAAGIATATMIKKLGIKHIYACNSKGLVKKDNRNERIQTLIAEKIITPFDDTITNLDAAFTNKDIFIGLSSPNLVTPSMIEQMNHKPWVLALANPLPEISYDDAQAAGADIIATGRSDYPNQINNVLAFPGIFRGVLKNKIAIINEDIKLLAARAIAMTISSKELRRDYILPSALNKKVVPSITKAITNYKK